MSVQDLVDAVSCARCTPAEVVVHLAGGPAVTVDGATVEVPEGGVRLLALIALTDGALDRRHVAGRLWPDADDVRAAGSVRTALWRLRTAGIDLVSGDRTRLWLRAGTEVDVRRARAWAAQVLDAPDPPTGSGDPGPQGDWRGYTRELLPGCYDEWVVFERERLRLRVLQALEHLSRRLARTGRWAEALDAALTAVQADPLRESAQTALVQAHLAEGNIVAAVRCFDHYRRALSRELGVAPGQALTALVTQALATRR